MDTYPEFEQAEGTTRRLRSGIMIRTATNGASRARALASVTHGDPTLVHLALTPTELSELEAFHEAHRGIAFDLDFWPESVTIACMFQDPPYDVKAFVVPGGLRYRVQVNLIQQ
jgi:hypothetical protein